ncbi:MAG: hypothetical protein HY866_22285 [Chloroflexi bacterium]|nr:hypothetical protein [Chloroflexota bacterium]
MASDSVIQKTAKIRERLSPRVQRGELIGCSEQELEELKQAQNVTCLPEIYSELLRLMGKQGMGQTLDAYADHKYLLGMKSGFVEDMNEIELCYPKDAFVFWRDQQGCGYWFFRTRGCETDPAVYEYREASCFYKLAETLSEFILMQVDIDPEIRKVFAENIIRSRSINLYFDLQTDDFYAPHEHLMENSHD